jgi:DNA-binding IclR family transcriptional regulator
VGVKRPLYCTSLGKAIAAYLPADEIEDALASGSMERLTPHTIIHAGRLKKEFAKIRLCGYAVDDEEAVMGVRCVAAPIFDESGKVTAAISASGPVTRVTAEKARAFAAAVRKGAYVISSRLGYSGL